MVAENYMVTAGIAPMRSTVTLPADTRRGAVTAQPVNPVLDPEPDTRVMAHPDFSFSHGAVWAKTLRSTYDFTPLYFTSNEASAPQSILPLMEVNSWLTCRRRVALPFTDSCGPLGADAAAVGRWSQNALEFEKSRGWKSAKFRGGGEHFGNMPTSFGFCGHSLKLEADENPMFARLEGPYGVRFTRPKKRSQSRCASGTRRGEDLLHAAMPDAQEAWPAAPAVRLFSEHVRAYLVEKLSMFITAPHQRRPLAAGLHFQLGDRAIYKYGASNEKLQHLRGAKLVMWEAIKQLVRNGVRTLNLCRTGLGNEGLRRFKLGLGDGDQKIEYDKYDLREGRFVTEIDAASGWCSHAFRVLPLRVLHLIGAAPYRHCA